MKTRTAIFLFLGAIFLFMMFISWYLKVENSNYEGRIAELDSINSDLLESVKARDLSIRINKARIIVIKDSLVAVQQELDILKRRHRQLRDDYDDLSSKVDQIPIDESYNFLISEVYPYKGEMIYPFNEPQVRGIHLTYLEKISLESININYQEQIKNYVDQITLKNREIRTLESSFSLSEDNVESYIKITENQGEVINIQDNIIDKQKRNLLVWKILTGVAVAIGVIL